MLRRATDGGVGIEGEPAPGFEPRAAGVVAGRGSGVGRHGAVVAEEDDVRGARRDADLRGDIGHDGRPRAIDNEHLVGPLVELHLEGDDAGTGAVVVGGGQNLDDANAAAFGALNPRLAVAVAGHPAVATHAANLRLVVAETGVEGIVVVAGGNQRGTEAHRTVGIGAELGVGGACKGEGEADVPRRRCCPIVTRTGGNQLDSSARHLHPHGGVDTRGKLIGFRERINILRPHAPWQQQRRQKSKDVVFSHKR